MELIDDPKVVFALALKRWFKANGWPQAITDNWAKDPGVLAPTGPWASQVCGAMKGDFHPRVEFFLAFAKFNDAVAQQQFKTIQVRKVRDRLTNALPLTTDNGQPYGATEFFQLFTGLIDPPKQFETDSQFEQSDLDDILKACQDKFRALALAHMCSRAEAWQMVRERLEQHPDINADQLPMIQEILAGLASPTVDEYPASWKQSDPIKEVLLELLP